MRTAPSPIAIAFEGLLAFFVIGTFIAVLVCCADMRHWRGTEDNHACNDYNPCTTNLLLPDGSCAHRPMSNGTDCTAEDVCYRDSRHERDEDEERDSDRAKFCCDGTCVSRSPHSCRGHCREDSDCLRRHARLPLRREAMDDILVDTFCLGQSCITIVVGGFTSDCLSWLHNDCQRGVCRHHRHDDDDEDHDHDRNHTDRFRDSHFSAYLKNCLYTRFEDVGGLFPPGICLYRFRCAPLSFCTTEVRSASADAAAAAAATPPPPGSPTFTVTDDALTAAEYAYVQKTMIARYNTLTTSASTGKSQ